MNPHANGGVLLRDLNLPDNVAVANGVVFAYGSGENTRQAYKDRGLADFSQLRIKNSTHAVLYALDALTGMEASLRFAGPESMDTKIFGRLTAWQNWIFQRPNAVGPQGALTNYGKPTQAQFDYKRT